MTMRWFVLFAVCLLSPAPLAKAAADPLLAPVANGPLTIAVPEIPGRQSRYEDEPSITRIVIQPGKAARIDGSGPAGQRVTLTAGGRLIGIAEIAANGQWSVDLAQGFKAGEHRIVASLDMPVEARTSGGDEVRIAVPEEISGAPVVAFERPAPIDVQRERAERLADAATKTFSEIVPDAGRRDSEERRSDGVRIAQQDDATVSKAPEDAQTEPGSGLGILNWMRRSAREFNGVIIKELSKPTGTSAPADDAPSEAAKSSTPTPAEAAKIVVEERKRAEEAARAKSPAAVAPLAKPADPAAAEQQRREAADLARKKADGDAKIAEGLKSLEAAKKARDEERAKETKRLADEAARKEAADKAAAAATEAKQRKDEAAADAAKRKRDAQEAKAAAAARALSDRKQPQPNRELADDSDNTGDAPESFGDAVARERGEAEKADTFVLPGDAEDDLDIKERSHVSQAKSKAHKVASYSKRRHASGPCRKGRIVSCRGNKRCYLVGSRDTLWGIARRIYGNGEKYRLIYKANRGRIANPHIVRRCQKIVIPRTRR